MKVKKIVIKGFKAIESLEKNIEGNIIITGENGKGKSSVMQFIEIALGRTNNIPPEATGEGYIIADKAGNEYTFYVKFKDGKPQLRITTPDGLSDDRKGSIAKIVGAIEFDINAFLNQSKSEKGRKEQVETFKRLLPEVVRTEILKLEANAQTYYNERAEINRKLAQTSAAIKKHRLFHAGGDLNSFKPIDTGAVLAQMQAAQKRNTELQGYKDRMDERTKRKIELKGDGVNSMGKVADLQKQLKDIENQMIALNMEAIDIEEKNEKATEYLKVNKPVDISGLEDQITNADKANGDYKDAQELLTMLTEEVALTNEAGDKTVVLETERQAIKDAIKDMSNPVPGLAYDDDGLYYQGIPVHPDSLAFSKIIELGVKMRIAENPDLPLFIPNGESLGNDILKELITVADANGLQIFMEQFERGKDRLELEVMGDFEPVTAPSADMGVLKDTGVLIDARMGKIVKGSKKTPEIVDITEGITEPKEPKNKTIDKAELDF